MQKFHFRSGIAKTKFMGHIVIPASLNELKQKTQGLDMEMKLCSGTKVEVSFLDKEKREWKYPVDLESRTCSCRQWDVVNPGFKLCAPVLKRAAGRPRKSRYRTRSEGAGLGARKRKCTRCGGSGHFGRYCDNADRKSTRLNSSHSGESRMPSSA